MVSNQVMWHKEPQLFAVLISSLEIPTLGDLFKSYIYIYLYVCMYVYIAQVTTIYFGVKIYSQTEFKVRYDHLLCDLVQGTQPLWRSDFPTVKLGNSNHHRVVIRTKCRCFVHWLEYRNTQKLILLNKAYMGKTNISALGFRNLWFHSREKNWREDYN